MDLRRQLWQIIYIRLKMKSTVVISKAVSRCIALVFLSVAAVASVD